MDLVPNLRVRWGQLLNYDVQKVYYLRSNVEL